MNVHLTIDGSETQIAVAPGDSLMDALRRAGKTSVKNGCDRGDCGSCAVLVGGRAVNACLVFAAQVDGAEIGTVEGLARGGQLHPLQSAAVDGGAVQCGFCTPGMLVLAYDLLSRNPDPDEAAVRSALSGSFCRCTGYVKPIEAILAAAGILLERRS